MKVLRITARIVQSAVRAWLDRMADLTGCEEEAWDRLRSLSGPPAEPAVNKTGAGRCSGHATRHDAPWATAGRSQGTKSR